MIDYDQLTSWKRSKKLPSYFKKQREYIKLLDSRLPPQKTPCLESHLPPVGMPGVITFFPKQTRILRGLIDTMGSSTKLPTWTYNGHENQPILLTSGHCSISLASPVTFLFGEQRHRFTDRTAGKNTLKRSCTKQPVTGDIQHCTWTIPGL